MGKCVGFEMVIDPWGTSCRVGDNKDFSSNDREVDKCLILVW